MSRSVLSLALLLLASCASGNHSIGIGIEGRGLQIGSTSGPTHSLLNAPPGSTIEVGFFDPMGMPTGESQTFLSSGNGILVPHPAGTATVAITVTPPPSLPVNAGERLRWPVPEQTYDLFVLPVAQPALPSSTTSTIGKFQIRSRRPEGVLSLFSKVQDCVVYGPGSPLSENVDVGFLIQSDYTSSGVTLTVSDRTEEIEAFSLGLNGATYATLLDNSLVYDAGNGWEAVEVEIPFMDLMTDDGAFDDATVYLDTAEDSEFLVSIQAESLE